jgi:hypothetical protein
MRALTIKSERMQPATAPSCKDQEMLKDRLRADLKVYRAAVDALESLALKQGIDRAFEKAAKNAKVAERAFENARERLDRHVAMHACK